MNCMNNELTELDVSNNFALTYLLCSHNLLSTIDISNNLLLEYLACGSNNIKTLDISNNVSLSQLLISSMPSLNEVCVWTTPFPPSVRIYVYSSNSPNAYFTTDCSN